MELTLAYLTEQVLRRYNGGHIPDEPGLRKEDIRAMIASAANYHIRSSILQGMVQMGERSLEPFLISTFENQEIKYSEDRGRHYVVLPKNVINLPGRMSPVEIQPMQGDIDSFIPLAYNFQALSKGNPAAMLEGNIGFNIEGRNCWLYNFETYSYDMKKVLVRMLASITSFNDDEILPITGDLEAPILDYCYQQLLGKRIPPDSVNDNSVE